MGELEHARAHAVEKAAVMADQDKGGGWNYDGPKGKKERPETMAMTAIDLLTNPNSIVAAKKEHATAMGPIREGLAKVGTTTAP